MELLRAAAPAAGFKPALQLAVGSSHQHQASCICLLFKEQPHSSSCSLMPKSQRFKLLFDLGKAVISQVKNLTLSGTLTSRACLFKMEFNHGDIFPSIPALFIIFPDCQHFHSAGEFH